MSARQQEKVWVGILYKIGKKNPRKLLKTWLIMVHIAKRTPSGFILYTHLSAAIIIRNT